ncbi:MAG: multidrug ABC transporter ATP-binding protein, partial [Rubrivivax sp.]
MFQRFERLVAPYPEALPPPPPRKLLAFMWRNSEGLRGWLLLLTLLTAAIGAFEALLFSMMAHIIDLLGKTPPASFFSAHGGTLWMLGGVLLLSIAFAAL